MVYIYKLSIYFKDMKIPEICTIKEFIKNDFTVYKK